MDKYIDNRWPIEVMVRNDRAAEFRDKLSLESDCKIINLREWISGELLQYIIQCPIEKESYITELAFMTFIQNPKFQKYYHAK